MSERVSFEDSEETVEPVRGLKINSSKSKFAQKAQEEEQFEHAADDVHNKIQDRRARAMEIAKQFWECMNSKVLAVNKGPIQKSTEKELVSKLQLLATEMNGDILEPEGSGSVAMFTLLFKTCMLYRDRLNEAEYKIEQLEKIASKSTVK